MIVDEFYTIGQVYELTGIEISQLRYIEKMVGLQIKRNVAGERIYTQANLETFKFISELKDKGLNYKAIKNVLEHKGEILSDDEKKKATESLIIPDAKLQKFMEMIKTTIDKSIDAKVSLKIESIVNSVDILVKQNQSLKEELEHEHEKHFIELDKKLTNLRNVQIENQNLIIKKQQEKPKTWYKRIFG
ncbi:helix-turn-helix domain-containing protein [Clostridium estertheticum]|uniref:helix-turn-helix domain-containing protein n=1 Tax=Clostridium estertheticum TaxID=238834 RepID=UPI001C0DFD87|nr:helix-turn-helix domain-containing protein [Clostridium estertheticum]MBU3173399.1 helix-turn-helix domain-containing protein [Clostridium estertheticum]